MKKGFTLAEGATHVGTCDNVRKFAFTLAEVLIVLAIIGMVAVLTVPNLVQEYKKRAIVSQLQRTIALLDTGFRKMVADDGVDYIFQTKLWSPGDGRMLVDRPTFTNYFKSEYTGDRESLYNYTLEYREYFMSVCLGWEYLEKEYDEEYLEKFPNAAGGTYFTNECTGYEDESQGFRWLSVGNFPWVVTNYAPAVLSNGVFMWTEVANTNSLSSRIYVDVNGKQGPNQYGYDIHKLGLTKEGHVIPMNINGKGEYDIEGGTIGAKRIKDDGWKMKY